MQKVALLLQDIIFWNRRSGKFSYYKQISIKKVSKKVLFSKENLSAISSVIIFVFTTVDLSLIVTDFDVNVSSKGLVWKIEFLGRKDCNHFILPHTSHD